METELLKENFENLQREIEAVCRGCGRDPADVTVIWVSKGHSRDRVEKALKLGAVHLGESRAQEVLEKYPGLDLARRQLHFIGRIQSNKVRKIIAYCDWMHSVDSLPLLERIDRICVEEGKIMRVFLQVNTSAESSKAGFSPNVLLEQLSRLPPLKAVSLRGLMTIGPQSQDREVTRSAFKKLAELLDTARRAFTGPAFARFDQISMGMSGDFSLAIEEGSHYIRIGTRLFGNRIR